MQRGRDTIFCMDEKKGGHRIFKACFQEVIFSIQIALFSKFIHVKSTETASGNRVRQFVDILNGISKEDAKKITNLVKSSKMKVQASINGDEVRITGKKRDDLQAMIDLLKQSDIGIPLQYQNFRD